MAVLKDLIVHGPSRFLSRTYFEKIQAQTIGAEEGVFNKLIATTGDIGSLNVEDLTAGKATVLSLLDVRGELHTNQWTNSNIATIDGSFYITPTIGVSSGTMTTTANSVTVNGSNFPISSLYVNNINSDNASDNNTNIVAWTSGSKVLVTGEILVNGIYMPLGTLVGVLDGNASATQIKVKSITDNRYQTAESLAEIGVQSTALPCRNVKISLYQTSRSSTLYPLGIFMTALGENGKTFLDIYGGGYAASTAVAGGFAKPVLRIGNLKDLPTVGAQTPTGYGIYTSNGYFSGVIVAKQGKIGDGTAAWTIGNDGNNRAYIYSGITNITSSGSTTGTYVGTNGISNYNSTTQYVNLTGGKITAQGADIAGKITASSGSIGGWNIGTDTNKSLYYGNQTPGATTTNLVLSPTSATNSNAIGGSGTGLTWFISAGKVFGVTTAGALYSTSGKIGGFDIGTTYLRNGNITSATNTSVAGVYLGTDGLNISNGTAATTSYITKTAVNIGNKLTWNGTTLTIDGSASIGGTTASTVVSNAANGATAKEGLDNLQIGGRNLFRYTSLTDVMSNKWNKTGTVACSVNGDKLTITGAGEVFPTSTYYTHYVIPINTTITLSCYFYENTISDGNRYIYYAVTPGWRNKQVPANYVGLWSETFTTTEELTVLCPEYDLRNSTGGQWVVSPLKLEIGNKATAWSPAPEDLDVHKYVTEIDSNGIWVTPSGKKPTNTSTGAGATGARVNGDGLQIYKAGVQVASYGTDATIGQLAPNLYNVFIDADSGISLRKNDVSLLTINSSQIDINNSSGNVMTRVNSGGLTVYDGNGIADANIQARFGTTVQVGKKAVGYVSIASTGMDIYAGSSNINLAHFGYDNTETSESESSSVISDSPFFSMGQRRTVISSERGDNASIITTVSNRYDYDADQEMPVPPGSYSTVIGYNNVAIGLDSCAEGKNTITYGNYAHSEGCRTAAIGFYSHAEGYGSEASGNYSHAEGYHTIASDSLGSHAEGWGTVASGTNSHAEGGETTASGNYSHTEGCQTVADGGFSHAGGYKTNIRSFCTGAFVHGIDITATTDYQTIFGKYPNVSFSHAFVIGNGTDGDNRSNAFAIDWDGDVNIASGAKYKINGTALSASDVGAVPTSRTINSKALSSNITLTASDVGAVPTNGNAGTCSYPAGFASRTTGATWGNTIGTSFTSWNDSTGGSIDFRQDNPSSGKVSIKVDGRFYYNEGNTAVWGLTSANGYWGMTDPDGNTNTNCWIRTTQAGIIPYQSGGRGGGHNYVGTDSWYFSQGYIDNIHGVTLDFNAATISGTTTIGGVTRINNSLYCDILYAGSGVINADLSVGGTVRSPSDKRIKTHLKYLNVDDAAARFVQQLRPAYYIKNNKPEVGFYAQDVQEADPWNVMVESDEKGMLNLSYTEIIAPLVSYCHSLEKRIKELEARK